MHPVTKSSFPCANGFASAAIGFSLRAARPGAIQGSSAFWSGSAANAYGKAGQNVIKTVASTSAGTNFECDDRNTVEQTGGKFKRVNGVFTPSPKIVLRDF